MPNITNLTNITKMIYTTNIINKCVHTQTPKQINRNTFNSITLYTGCFPYYFLNHMLCLNMRESVSVRKLFVFKAFGMYLWELKSHMYNLFLDGYITQLSSEYIYIL